MICCIRATTSRTPIFGHTLRNKRPVHNCSLQATLLEFSFCRKPNPSARRPPFGGGSASNPSPVEAGLVAIFARAAATSAICAHVRIKLRARRKTELLVHRCEVLLNRLWTDPEFSRNARIRLSARRERRDFVLALREQDRSLGGLSRRGRLLGRPFAFEASHVICSATAAIQHQRRVPIARGLERLSLQKRKLQAPEAVGGIAYECRCLVPAFFTARKDANPKRACAPTSRRGERVDLTSRRQPSADPRRP